MVGDQQRKQHFCKACNKSYPSGKSLGGHMRYHKMYGFPSKPEGKPNFQMKSKRVSQAAFNGGERTCEKKSRSVFVGCSNYGLRENPKKTWRAAEDSRLPLPREKFCRECGKHFVTLRALFGHMSSHSSSKRASISKRSRSRDHLCIENVLDGEVSETEQVEDVALCLLMLSRDTGPRKNAKSDSKSLDNDHVGFEEESEFETALFQNSGSGCSGNAASKRVKQKASADEFAQIDELEYLKGEDLYGHEAVTVDAEMGNGLSKSETRTKNQWINGNGYDLAKEALLKTDSRLTAKNHFRRSESYGTSHRHDVSNVLGGYKETDSSSLSMYNSGENNTSTKSTCNEVFATELFGQEVLPKHKKERKMKGKLKHICEIGQEEFSLGQGLSFRQTVQLIGGLEGRSDDFVFEQRHALPVISQVFDLNLPAPFEE